MTAMRFEKVLVVNPPSPPGFTANRDSMGGFGQLYAATATVLPPLDVPYLAAFLDAKKIPLTVIEAEGLHLDTASLTKRIQQIAQESPAAARLAVVRTSLPSLDWDLSVCEAMKAADPLLKTAIFGPVVPHVLKRLYQVQCLDYVIQGEPDDTVYELAAGKPEAEILGLTRRSNGSWVSNASRPFLKELDQLPFPKWELFPIESYAVPRSSAVGNMRFLPMLSSRGCPFGCHYCPYPVGQGLPWRHRSPANVVDEIEHLVRDFRVEYILFRDPMFSMRLDRVQQICAEIVRRGLKFRWKCETRPDCLDEKTVLAMAAAGCDGINFGVESAEVEIQKGVGRKPIARERIIEMTALCRRHGIKTFCFFIIGLPGDTVETILETIQFAIRLRPNWLQFTAATPFIGTKLRQWAIQQGLTKEDDYAYVSSHQATVGNENLTKSEVEALYLFALWTEKFLNRAGVLKDRSRTGFFYSQARAMADWASEVVARAIYAVARMRFRTLSREVQRRVKQRQDLAVISAS